MAFASTNWMKIDQDLITTLDKIDANLVTHVNKVASEVIKVERADQISDFRVYQRNRKETVTTDVSIAPFFKGDGSYDNFKFSYFIGAFSDRFQATTGTGASIIADRFGFGMEIELTITELKSSVRGGFGMIAAAAEMNIATAQYSYAIRALPEGKFHNLLPPIGKFDATAIQKFKELTDKLKELYTAGIQGLQLSAIEVLVAEAIKEEDIENVASYYFGAKRLIHGHSLEEAIKSARLKPNKYNEDAISYVYSRAGLQSLKEKPTPNSIDIAKKIIFDN